jgi:hypothetical protein
MSQFSMTTMDFGFSRDPFSYSRFLYVDCEVKTPHYNFFFTLHWTKEKGWVAPTKEGSLEIFDPVSEVEIFRGEALEKALDCFEADYPRIICTAQNSLTNLGMDFKSGKADIDREFCSRIGISYN